MKNTFKALSILGTLVIAGGLAGTTLAAQSHRAGNPQGAVSAPLDVLAIAQQQGMASIMVYLNETASMRSTSDKTSAGEAAYTSANLALQGGVLSSAFGSAAGQESRRLRQVEFIPAFAVLATADEIRALRADPRVASVVENRVSKPLLLDSVGIVKMTGAGNGYAKGATGKGQAVAVIDTGVNSSHEFMTGKVISEACFSAGGPGGSMCPGGTNGTGVGKGADCLSTLVAGCGHGSHVAGIAAGFNTSPGAGEPLHGIAKRASVVAINVFTDLGGGLGAYDVDIILGLQRVFQLRNGVANKRIRAVNMSLGGGQFFTNCNTFNPAMTAAIVKLRDKGIATVIATGNNGFTDPIAYPGCISKAIAVASSSKRNGAAFPEHISSFSNMSAQVDAIAPGGEIRLPVQLHPRPDPVAV